MPMPMPSQSIPRAQRKPAVKLSISSDQTQNRDWDHAVRTTTYASNGQTQRKLTPKIPLSSKTTKGMMEPYTTSFSSIKTLANPHQPGIRRSDRQPRRAVPDSHKGKLSCFGLSTFTKESTQKPAATTENPMGPKYQTLQAVMHADTIRAEKDGRAANPSIAANTMALENWMVCPGE
ncbi:hypothetical protein HBH53_192860 [Parastagonospora nodorum]|nr:hypothetical protein HBH53_192860 [Parastagonospora nodorum]KAH6487253.1 hypothetical protein HBI55_182820 [Parastagonospora nodorum]